MQTVSVMLQNLCVPCHCRCRYCLLSWNGKAVGIDAARGERLAKRFHAWMRANRPEVAFHYSFGYSMEHPDLLHVVDFLRSIGSVGADFLQMDGMALRSDAEACALMGGLRAHGVKRLNFTFYGLAAYHDAFAARRGDFDNLLRMSGAGLHTGLEVSAGIPVTHENAGQIDSLIELLEQAGLMEIRLFVPHAEGRGTLLDAVRFTESDFEALPERARQRLNTGVYKAESEWLAAGDFAPEEKRAILISLTPENIERYERLPIPEIIAEVEALDDAYYGALPPPKDLAERYGDAASRAFYHRRDLLRHYRGRYMQDHQLRLWDVTDERFSGSRRF